MTEPPVAKQVVLARAVVLVAVAALSLAPVVAWHPPPRDQPTPERDSAGVAVTRPG